MKKEIWQTRIPVYLTPVSQVAGHAQIFGFSNRRPFAFKVPPEAAERTDFDEIRDPRRPPIAELLRRPLLQSVRRMILKQ